MRQPSPAPDRGKFRMPWDEKTKPAPAPERVEIPNPWDERVATPSIPKLPVPKQRGR